MAKLCTGRYNPVSVNFRRFTRVALPYISKPCASLSTSSTTSRDSEVMTLRDQRSLGFSQYGSPTGAPMLFFHGLPSSRLECAEWDDLGKEINALIIGVDRPGMGLSTFQPNRRILDWPSGVQQLARFLGLDQYRVMGGSGGAPYALACAKVLPRETLRGVGILAGIGPLSLGTEGAAFMTRFAGWFPTITPLLIKWMTEWILIPAAHNPDREVFVKKMETQLKRLKEKDRVVFKDENSRRAMIETVRESLRQGAQGYVEEVRLLTMPWGFELEEVAFDKVKLWYGTEDHNTPIRMGRLMAQRLKHAELKEYPGETHFTLADNHSKEILEDLLET